MPTFGPDPRAFIRHNLLTLDAALDYPAPNLLFSDGTVRVRLVDVTNDYQSVYRNRNRKGLARLIPRTSQTWWTKPAQIYKVTPADGMVHDDAFAAYICPYADNQVNFKTLGGDADVMFTGDMDGCTFGVGIPNPLGHVRVGHANAQNQATGTTFNPDFAPQRAHQTNSLTQGGTAQSLVDPDAYRDGAPQGTEYKAVTIGLRIDGVWEFYYQHQNVDGFAMRDKLATTRIA